MGQSFSIIDVFKELPLEEMKAEAKELKIDYKSKKLDSMIGLPTTITRRVSESGVGRVRAISYEPRRGGVFVGKTG
ncbi:MAG: hypothetical protein K2H58_08770 [Paramuribaculum sp.]|nr:hypothetical protein [Paramuribaculum sp.]